MGEVRRVDQAHPEEALLSYAHRVLCSHGVVVMPTDSVYGIGCAATAANPARERIFRIKKRPLDMALPWLIADSADLDRYGTDVPAWARELARAFWPGALTLVVRASDEVPDEYRHHPDHTIALRVPDSPLVRELARRVGLFVVTSANTHGQLAAARGETIEEHIVSEANLTLDGGRAPLSVASTIVACLGETPCVVREGAISTVDIMRVATAD